MKHLFIAADLLLIDWIVSVGTSDVLLGVVLQEVKAIKRGIIINRLGPVLIKELFGLYFICVYVAYIRPDWWRNHK